MSYQHIVVPTDGQKITCLGDAQCVPDNPIIAFIEGDGIGRDIMTASKRIWDAAVEKAYGGARGSPGWKFTPAKRPPRFTGATICPPRRSRRCASSWSESKAR